MSRELDVAIQAASAAGEVLRRNYEREVHVRYKGTFDLVTDVDVESERVIRDLLLRACPEYGVYAEEGAEVHGGGGRWIVDPLDGTTNYAHAFPFFAVSIALQRDERLDLGVVYNPVLDELFVSEHGQGATLNGRPLRVSTTDALARSLLCTGFPYDRTAAPAALELWSRFTMITQGMRRTGSAALDMCYVAAGRFDGYYERSIYPWDVAAGVVILEEAGGRVSSYTGGPVDLAGREIVASNGRIHDAVLGVIAGAAG